MIYNGKKTIEQRNEDNISNLFKKFPGFNPDSIRTRYNHIQSILEENPNVNGQLLRLSYLRTMEHFNAERNYEIYKCVQPFL